MGEEGGAQIPQIPRHFIASGESSYSNNYPENE